MILPVFVGLLLSYHWPDPVKLKLHVQHYLAPWVRPLGPRIWLG